MYYHIIFNYLMFYFTLFNVFGKRDFIIYWNVVLWKMKRDVKFLQLIKGKTSLLRIRLYILVITNKSFA